jgi:hypothetical protein
VAGSFHQIQSKKTPNTYHNDNPEVQMSGQSVISVPHMISSQNTKVNSSLRSTVYSFNN